MYVNEDFIDCEVENIPGIKEMKNIQNKKIPFYEVAFDENAEYDYLVYQEHDEKKFIIVNSKYTIDPNNYPIINNLINTNTSYEREENRIFYGRLVPSRDTQQSTLLENNQQKALFTPQDLLLKDAPALSSSQV